MVIQPAFMHYVHTTWLHINSQRFLFSHHYFENTPKRFKRAGKHSGGIETKTVLELQKRELISVYRGWWEGRGLRSFSYTII